MAIFFAFLVVSGLTIGLLSGKYRFNVNGNENGELNFTGQPNASSEQLLVDKVFTFLAPEDSQQFEDLYLYKGINYYVLVEIVTPHNCEIKYLKPKSTCRKATIGSRSLLERRFRETIRLYFRL